jgi:hypothetical protein
MKQIPHWGPTNIKRHHTKSSRQRDVVPGTFANSVFILMTVTNEMLKLNKHLIRSYIKHSYHVFIIYFLQYVSNNCSDFSSNTMNKVHVFLDLKYIRYLTSQTSFAFLGSLQECYSSTTILEPTSGRFMYIVARTHLTWRRCLYSGV